MNFSTQFQYLIICPKTFWNFLGLLFSLVPKHCQLYVTHTHFGKSNYSREFDGHPILDCSLVVYNIICPDKSSLS